MTSFNQHLCAALGTSLLTALCAFTACAQTPTDPQLWPAGPRDTLMQPTVESFVQQLLTRMTLEQKVGQMIQADIDSIAPQDLLQYPLGSIIAGGNAAPDGDVRAAPTQWLTLIDAFAQAAATQGSKQHPAIPLLFGIDAVHGHARMRGATIFPHNIGLGAAHDPQLIERIGQVTAAEVAATGFNWTFAPTVAVVRDPRWGRTYESFSEDPQQVAGYAAAGISGLQGKLGSADFMTSAHTVASVKHFLGDGGTRDGRDQFDNQSSLADLIRIHAAGYPPAIAAGALTVMASYNAWHGIKMHANRELLTDVLKGRLGFNGFVIGDWNAQEEIPGCTKSDCAAVINAGVDMIMAPDSWKGFYSSTLAHVRDGQISPARIDDAVRRILRVKVLAGLFNSPRPADRAAVAHLEQLGAAAHRAIAREAARKSLVLLKNNAALLPLNPRSRILVTGRGADDIGMQSGGWSVDWQGAHNSNADFPGATSIFAGLQSAISAAGGSVELSRDGQFKRHPDVAIVVFGEQPYAEFEGDRETLEFSPTDSTDLHLLRSLRARGIPVVSVFLSGRPLWVNREINASDAFVVAWLPGSEGAGIADVLLRTPTGSVNADFSGRLPFSWPASIMPVQLDGHDVPIAGAQFARGYGLTYAHSKQLDRLREVADAAADRNGADVLFAQGHVTAPASIYVIDSAGQVRLTTASQRSPTGALTVSLDSNGITASWSGDRMGEMQIGARAQDQAPLAARNRALQLKLRVAGKPKGRVQAGVRCTAPYGAGLVAKRGGPAMAPDGGQGCGIGQNALFDVTQALRAVRPGHWTTLEISLACLARRGADLSLVSAPVALTTDGQLDMTISDIRYVQSNLGNSCVTTSDNAHTTP